MAFEDSVAAGQGEEWDRWDRVQPLEALVPRDAYAVALNLSQARAPPPPRGQRVLNDCLAARLWGQVDSMHDALVAVPDAERVQKRRVLRGMWAHAQWSREARSPPPPTARGAAAIAGAAVDGASRGGGAAPRDAVPHRLLAARARGTPAAAVVVPRLLWRLS